MTPEQQKQNALALESKEINDANRIKQLLEDPAITEWLLAVQRSYFDEFQRSDGSPEALRSAWAKSQALSAFNAGALAIKGRGEQAEHARTIREAQEAATRRATPRK